MREEISRMVFEIKTSDMLGHFLAQRVSLEFRDELDKLTNSQRTEDEFPILPNLSPIDLIVLAVMCDEVKNGEVPLDVKDKVLSGYLHSEGAYNYSIYRLKRLNIIKEKPRRFELNPLACKIVDTALALKPEVEEKIKRDSLIGWVYAEEIKNMK
jgi:hypothetical protein